MVKQYKQRNPPPLGGQSYCELVLGEGNCMTLSKGGEGSEGVGIIGDLRGGEGVLRRSKRRRHLPTIRTFKHFFMDRRTV